MTLRELKQIVSLGEGVSLEFKRKVPRDERIAKELIALANTHGGRILLGVDDDGTITGVDDAAEEEFVLRRAADTHCQPPIEFTTERIAVATRRDVLLVTVPESTSKPHHLVDGAEQLNPVRNGRLEVSIAPVDRGLEAVTDEPKAEVRPLEGDGLRRGRRHLCDCAGCG